MYRHRETSVHVSKAALDRVKVRHLRRQEVPFLFCLLRYQFDQAS